MHRAEDFLAKDLAAACAGDGLVMAFGGLGGGGEDRLRQLRAIEQAFGERVVEDAASLLVFLEAAAGEVTADNCFDWEGLELTHEHRARDQVFVAVQGLG